MEELFSLEKWTGKKIDIVSSFQRRGEFLDDRLSQEKLLETYKKSCPGQGACGGMYTANTMSSAIEALGMSLPYSSLCPKQAKQFLPSVRNEIEPYQDSEKEE